MAKYEATPIGQGFGSQSRINENFENIEENLQRVLYRDGSSPNHMLADLDMNSQRIINLPSATSASEPATYAQLLAAQIGGAVPFVATFKETQTATADQQVITLTLVPYIPGSNNLSLYINGVRMAGDAYTETGPNTITLSEALEAGDKIEAVINERTVESAFSFTGIAKEIFTATAGQTVFNITGVVYNPGSGNLSVYVDGVRQAGTAYSEDTPSSFSFLSPLAGGETVEIIVNERPVSADTVPASSVTVTIDSINTNVLDNLKKNQPIANVAALKALTGIVDGAVRQTLGYHTAAIGGNGIYRFEAASADTANDVTVLQPDSGGGRWKLLHNGVVSFEQAGARADGTDASAAINAAFATGIRLTAKRGSTFDVSSSILIPSNSHFIGEDVTIRRKTGSGVFDVVKNSDQTSGNSNIKLDGLSVDGNKAADSLVATTSAHRFSGISMVKVTGGYIVSGTVRGTVNAEAHGGVYCDQCVRFDVIGVTATDQDRSGIVLFNNVNCTFFRNKGFSNSGSGITGGNNTDCTYMGNVTHNNGSGGSYSGLNPTGLRVKVISNVSYSNTGSGINIGEAIYDGSDAEVIGNICYSNTFEGITVGYSDRVRVVANEVHSNIRNNIRIFQGADECVVANNIVRDSAGGQGIYVDDGVRHNITGNLVKGNAISGISIDPTATDGICKGNICINNGVITSANSAGILANTTTGWLIDGNQCYDTAGAVGTQESGIWMAGGSGNVVSGNRLHTNKTNSIRETSSPSYERRFNKVGTDPLRGTFTSAASTTTTVNNNNATAVSRIKVWPTNAGGVGKIPFVSSVVSGVSFTITLPSAGAGTETYAYEIE